MRYALIALLAIVGMGACTNADKSRTTLEKSGYTDITIGGHSYFSCGSDDAYSTKFTAKNPAGSKVEGTVCCGWLKSCTIRF